MKGRYESYLISSLWSALGGRQVTSEEKDLGRQLNFLSPKEKKHELDQAVSNTIVLRVISVFMRGSLDQIKFAGLFNGRFLYMLFGCLTIRISF